MKDKIAYDLDGTLCARGKTSVSYFKAKTSELRRAWRESRKDFYINTYVIRKPIEKEYIIITSRKHTFRDITLDWLKRNGLEPKEVHLMEGFTRNRVNMIKYKSMKIKELGITKYYEDDPKIANRLAKICTDTEIITVEPVIVDIDVESFLKCSKKLKF